MYRLRTLTAQPVLTTAGTQWTPSTRGVHISHKSSYLLSTRSTQSFIFNPQHPFSTLKKDSACTFSTSMSIPSSVSHASGIGLTQLKSPLLTNSSRYFSIKPPKHKPPPSPKQAKPPKTPLPTDADNTDLDQPSIKSKKTSSESSSADTEAEPSSSSSTSTSKEKKKKSKTSSSDSNSDIDKDTTKTKDNDNESSDKEAKKLSEKELIESYWTKQEEAVKKAKEKKKEDAHGFPMSLIYSSARLLRSFGKWSVAVISDPKSIPGRLRGTWVFIKEEAHHFYLGFKLLSKDVRTSFGIMRKVTKGNRLTRREKRQLKRTTVDLFRLVPFSIFVLIPFMEVLLPVALKLFPQMLPSTFVQQDQKAKDYQRDLKARLEYAKFLQETMETMTKNLSHRPEDKSSLKSLLKDARNGVRIPNKKIIQVASLFRDEVTLDNLPRPSLVRMCQYMNISPFGPAPLLRILLNEKMIQLRRDDKLIIKEGVGSLSTDELKTANRDRGMRSVGLTKLGYERNLQQWLDLAVDPKVPISLLILSRAFAISETRPVAAETLVKVIETMPESAIDEALLESGGLDGADKMEATEKVTNEMIEETENQPTFSENLHEEISAVAEKVADIASESALASERVKLSKLMAEVETVNEEAEKSKEQRQRELEKDREDKESEGGLDVDEEVEAEPVDDVSTERLKTKLHNVIEHTLKRLEAQEAEIGDRAKELDLDDDGFISEDELRHWLTENQAYTYDRVEEVISALQAKKQSEVEEGFMVADFIALLEPEEPKPKEKEEEDETESEEGLETETEGSESEELTERGEDEVTEGEQTPSSSTAEGDSSSEQEGEDFLSSSEEENQKFSQEGLAAPEQPVFQETEHEREVRRECLSQSAEEELGPDENGLAYADREKREQEARAGKKKPR